MKVATRDDLGIASSGNSMPSCDHFFHDAPTGGLQRPHAAAGQEPDAFVLIAAVENVDAVARDGVMKCGAGVLGDESEKRRPPRIVGVTKQLSSKLF
jgi:hypothetical protein